MSQTSTRPLLLLALAPLALLLSQCASTEDSDSDKQSARAGDGPAIVDLRPGAHGKLAIPASEFSRRWKELEPYRAQPLLLRGSNQAEADRAAQTLRAEGFQVVHTSVR